jgi:hypothetical protein
MAVLAGAGAAYAALNTYAGSSVSIGTSKAGTPAKPVPTGYTETLTAANLAAGKVAAPLVNIKTVIYGLKADFKDFPTCSKAKITLGPKFNGNCPKGSEVSSGKVMAKLGGPTLDASKAIPCTPDLVVYNGGGGTEWFFFTTSASAPCAGLHTGQTPPYPGKVSYSGKNMVINVPLPADVSTMVAGQPNFYGSLIKETLKTTTEKAKVHGKTVYSLESIGCKGNKRPWSVTFSAVPAAGQPAQNSTVSGFSKC